MRAQLAFVTVCALASVAFGQVKDPGLGAFLPAQSVADVVREAANADIAFVAAGNLNAEFDKNDLATLIQFPTDPIVIVKLKGSEVRLALERSMHLYPQSNRSFLQLSGLTVEASGTASPDSRILNVKVGANELDEKATYQVAMPLSLGRGGMGYFKIWDKTKFVRTLDTTMETTLAGKKLTETTPRWLLRQ
jgi:2',3'-cyclic-nucleotide 2'-phosphodiesterase (5'-nucleotidase family)